MLLNTYKHHHFYRHTSSFTYILEYALLFLDDNVDDDVNDFQIAKVQPQGCNFIKKETPRQSFSCEFCEIFKNTFFT